MGTARRRRVPAAGRAVYKMKERIVIGMSGGVDSSAAAWLLKEQGYDVHGVYMVTRAMDEREQEAVRDAQAVCGVLDIPFETVDFTQIFRREVEDYFIRSYLAGETPNPCVVCNRKVKWEALLCYADGIGAPCVATGHYARVERLENGRLTVAMVNGGRKDQTYALYGLSQEQLARTRMPVGGYTKEQIRSLAAQAGLVVAAKPDSQDICFVPDGDYVGFLRRSGAGDGKKGHFIDASGADFGEHLGLCHYTVGQRKGLGRSFGRPVYVCSLDPESGNVLLGDNEELFRTCVVLRDFNAMGLSPELPAEEPIVCTGKIRYNQQAAPCRIFRTGGRVTAEFDCPQRAVTPGQAAVFYDDAGRVLGGGIIDRA